MQFEKMGHRARHESYHCGDLFEMGDPKTKNAHCRTEFFYWAAVQELSLSVTRSPR